MRFVEAFEIRPNSDRVMVEADSIEDRKIGSIVIPNQAGERTRIGTVVAVGPDAEKTFKIGDRVLFNVYSGINVYAPKYDELNETLKIFRAEELLATVVAK